MKPGGGRAKGHSWEREVAQLFREYLGCEARRGLQGRDGSEAPDVEVPGYWVECKHQRNPSAEHALRQAQAAAIVAGSDRVPIAVVKRNRSAPYVVLDLVDFLRLISSGTPRAPGRHPPNSVAASTR